MTATITATPEPAHTPPRIRLDVTGAAGSRIPITRVNRDGTSYLVRSANPAPLSAGIWSGFDYESPFDLAGTYSGTSDGGSSVTVDVAALVEWGVQKPWLIHPGIPALSQPLTVVNWGDRTKDTQQGVHIILGRSTPIVITDGVRRTATFPLTVRTSTLEDEAAMDALLADSSPLLLQIVYPGVDRILSDWVSVGAVTCTNLVDWWGTTMIHWTLPCTVTSAPAGLLQPERTYGNVLTDWASYNAVATHYTTYHDLLVGFPR